MNAGRNNNNEDMPAYVWRWIQTRVDAIGNNPKNTV